VAVQEDAGATEVDLFAVPVLAQHAARPEGHLEK
jgi:hypothetical protein